MSDTMIHTPINAETNATSISIIGKTGGIAIGSVAITEDRIFDQFVTRLTNGSPAAGTTIIVEDAAGNPVPYTNLNVGAVIVMPTKKIIYQVTIGEDTFTTNATFVTWNGGE